MKYLILALFLAVNAFAAGPDEDKCNQVAALKQIETKIIRELQGEISRLEKGAHVYSFHFTSVWRTVNDSDMAVYFETVSPDLDVRRAYAAQYTIDRKSCAPSLLKFQSLYGDDENPAGIETSSPVPEKCNEGAGLAALHAAIQKDIEDLYSKINPGEHTADYIFSGVDRAAKAGDMSISFARTRAHLMSVPMLAEYAVDPQTCLPHMLRTSTFTWSLVTY